MPPLEVLAEDGGKSFPEAFEVARKTGWIVGTKSEAQRDLEREVAAGVQAARQARKDRLSGLL